MAAIISVCESGFDIKDVLSASSNIKPVEGRMQQIDNCHRIIAIVDFDYERTEKLCIEPGLVLAKNSRRGFTIALQKKIFYVMK